MKTSWLIFGILAMIFIVIPIFFIFGMILQKEENNLDSFQSMQENPPSDYIQQLESIIRSNNESYVREQGIFTLTDIAIRNNETEKIIPFLKEIAMNEKQEKVRTAAYANINFIRSENPPEKKGTMELSILGDIKKGGNITLVAIVSSTIDTPKAIITIDKLNSNIQLTSSPIVKFNLKAHESKKIAFNLILKENGSYFIPVTFMMSFNRIDYETVHKRVYLTVNEKSGSYTQSER
jgi:hypothetical protein